MTILNLTQHPATPAQRKAGVIDMPDWLRTRLQKLLTFDTLPTASDVEQRAIRIAEMICDADAELHPDTDILEIQSVMIAGAPYLMPPLHKHCSQYCKVLYAFSERKSVEQTQPDGSVVKRTVFEHKGFVEL